VQTQRQPVDVECVQPIDAQCVQLQTQPVGADCKDVYDGMGPSGSRPPPICPAAETSCKQEITRAVECSTTAGTRQNTEQACCTAETAECSAQRTSGVFNELVLGASRGIFGSKDQPQGTETRTADADDVNLVVERVERITVNKNKSPKEDVGRKGKDDRKRSEREPRESIGGKPRESIGGKPRESIGATPRESIGGRPRESIGATPRESIGATPRESIGGRPSTK